jgi:branched-chain amino acid transport system substrate-binding protein
VDTGTAKGDPIVLGAICSCSGVQSATLARLKDVSQAWAKAVNAKDGINGHPVKLYVEDDGGTPAKALLAVKKLVEKDKVIAIVGDGSVADASWADYVSKKGVPVVGGLTPEAPFLSNPDFFTIGATLPVLLAGTMLLAKEAGKTKFGVLYCAEIPACAQAELLTKAIASVVGGMTVTSGKVSATAPNYTAPCLTLKNAGVDSLFVVQNGPVAQRVVDSCAQQGLHPTTVSQTSTSDPGWLKDPNFEGALLSSSNAQPTPSLPAAKEYFDAVDKYVPGLSSDPQFNFNAFVPWVSGKLFEAAAKAGNIGPTSTSADVKKGLYALKDETLGGLASPLNFTPGKPGFPTCYFASTIRKGAFTPLYDGKSKCLTQPQAAAIGQMLAALAG